METDLNEFEQEVEDNFSLNEILRVLFQHQYFIFWCILVCLTLSIFYAYLWPPTYEAITILKVPDTSQTTEGMLKALMETSGDPIKTYLGIAQSDSVAANAYTALNLKTQPGSTQGASPEELTNPGIIHNLKSAIKVENARDSDLITISAKTKNPSWAAELANAWAQGFIQVNLRLARESALTRYEFIHN